MLWGMSTYIFRRGCLALVGFVGAWDRLRYFIVDDDKTVSSILSGLETRSLGLNTLGTT